MAAVKGDKAREHVGIITRPVTAEDEKSGLYYSYFGGLTGTVDRVYDDGTVCVDIDLDSLPQEARIRHKAMEDAARERWLDSLSNEVRNRLTPEQKQLNMSYKILVLQKDLEPIKGGKPKGTKQSTEAAKDSAETAESGKGGPARAPEPAAPPVEPKDDEPAGKRVSEADLSAAEEDYLKSVIENIDV